MEFGDAIKKIRTDKGLTQKEVAFQVTSRSYLSLIEGNKYTPSFTIFNQLLTRLSITHEEFLFVLDRNHTPLSHSLFVDITHLTLSYDLIGLQKLADTTYARYLKEHHLFLHHIHLLCKSLRNHLRNKYILTEQVSQVLIPVKNYLLSCNQWHLYEIQLFNHSMFGFSVKDTLFFSQLALKSIEQYDNFYECQPIKQQILLNLSTLLITHNQYKQAYYYSKKALSEANQHLLLYEKIIAKLNIFICRYFLHKQKSTTIKDIKQLLDTLPILDLQALKNHYEEKLSIMGINLT